MEASETPPTGPIAGWYDDPNDQGQYRWWDGGKWTEHLHPKESAGADPAPSAQAAAEPAAAGSGSSAPPGASATSTPATSATSTPAASKDGPDIFRLIAIALVAAAVAATIYLLIFSGEDEVDPVPAPPVQNEKTSGAKGNSGLSSDGSTFVLLVRSI